LYLSLFKSLKTHDKFIVKTSILTIFIIVFSNISFAKYKVCYMTLNSSIEKELFTQHLSSGKNEGKFEFIELANGDKSNWLNRACASGVQCDILLISGHYNRHFFYGEHEPKYELSLEELEQNSCNRSCTGIMNNPVEVFLLGCNTLVGSGKTYELSHQKLIGDHVYEFGLSPVDRMRQSFNNVPGLYGFNIKAPTGKRIAPELQNYLTKIPDYVEHIEQKQVQRINYMLGRTEKISSGNQILVDTLKKYKILDMTGIELPCSELTDSDEDDFRSKFYRNLCILKSDSTGHEEKASLAYDLLHTPEFAMYIPTIGDTLGEGNIYRMLTTWLSYSTDFKNLTEEYFKSSEPDYEQLYVIRFLHRLRLAKDEDIEKLEKKLVDNFLQGKLSDADVETVCSHKGYFRLTESSDIDDRVLNNVNGLKMIKCLRKKDTKLAQRVIKKFESSSSNSAIKKAAYDVVDSFIRKDDSLKNFLQSNKK